jgi:hypothetical protein
MSEVQFEFAKNSELIFTMNGRHLCSSFNPTREAHQWATFHQPQWKDCEAIVVLGVGCGYHIRALQSLSKAQVVALDSNPSIVAAALRVHPLDLKDSDTIAVEEVSSSILPALEQATRKPYSVLIHEPSAFARPEWFSSTKDFLLGRNPKGLQWLFKTRGLSAPRLSDFEGECGVSLKTLDTLWTRQVLGQENLSPLMQALRELII